MYVCIYIYIYVYTCIIVTDAEDAEAAAEPGLRRVGDNGKSLIKGAPSKRQVPRKGESLTEKGSPLRESLEKGRCS